MVDPAVPVSKYRIEIIYWYRDRRSDSAECIMTGKGRGMEEQEENAVSTLLTDLGISVGC